MENNYKEKLLMVHFNIRITSWYLAGREMKEES